MSRWIDMTPRARRSYSLIADGNKRHAQEIHDAFHASRAAEIVPSDGETADEYASRLSEHPMGFALGGFPIGSKNAAHLARLTGCAVSPNGIIRGLLVDEDGPLGTWELRLGYLPKQGGTLWPTKLRDLVEVA